MRTRNQVSSGGFDDIEHRPLVDVPDKPSEILVHSDGGVASVPCSGKAEIATADMTHWNWSP